MNICNLYIFTHQCALFSWKGKLLKDFFEEGQILSPLYCPLLAEELEWDLGDFYIVFCLHAAFYAFEVILEDVSHMIVSVADVTDSTCYSNHIPSDLYKVVTVAA